jgi:hypothetical protein
VDRIGHRRADRALEGQTPPPPPKLVEPRAANPAYVIQWTQGPVTLTLNDYLWSPVNYAPLVNAPAAPAMSTACNTPDLLKRLLTPTVRVLFEADELLSKRLQEEPQNPCLHEEAAVLLADFAMRERNHRFQDTRPALNRMTAHLAIAHVLRNGQPAGVEGRLADLMLRAVAWRHDGFPEEIRGDTANATEPERTWLRVISLYSVQDWRELSDPAQASLAERLAYSLALAQKTSPSRVLGFLDRNAPEHIADWPRLAFARGASVEVCGRYGEVGISATLSEIAEAYRWARGHALEANQLSEALNGETLDNPGAVLDWPLWAGFEQRGLMEVLGDEYYCLERIYGQEDEANRFRKGFASHFADLRLMPLLSTDCAPTHAAYEQAATSAIRLIKERPQLVSYGTWSEVVDPVPSVGPPISGVPNLRSWFNPMVPHGTALNYNIRFTGGLLPPQELAEGATRHVFHVLAKRLYAQRLHGEKPPVAFLKTYYGNTVEFDRDALVSIADSAYGKEPEEYLAAIRAMCAMNTDDCYQVAVYLKDHGDPDGAAREYQKWFDVARDRVGVSNKAEWLVDYY